jgi:hypothetical protein
MIKKIFLTIILCLFTNTIFAAPLTVVEARAIMANITTKIVLEKSKVVVPVKPTPKPNPGAKKNLTTCPTGNCR